MEDNKVAWFAVLTCILGLIALGLGVSGFLTEDPYVLAQSGVFALLSVAAAILSLKE